MNRIVDHLLAVILAFVFCEAEKVLEIGRLMLENDYSVGFENARMVIFVAVEELVVGFIAQMTPYRYLSLFAFNYVLLFNYLSQRREMLTES